MKRTEKLGVSCLQALPRRCAALLLSTALLGLTYSPAALAQEALLRTITVTGQGTESVQTSLAEIRLGVESQGATAQAVQQEVARRSEAVIGLLRSRNVEKLATSGISLNPNYDYSNDRQRLTGYTATNIVSFRVPTERAGQLLDDAVQAGATRIDGISFVATDTALDAGERQALKEAIQNAQDQAEVVLQNLGLTPGEIVSIQVNGANTPPPILLRRDAVQTAASTPIIGGEQEVTAAVTLQIRY